MREQRSDIHPLHLVSRTVSPVEIASAARLRKGGLSVLHRLTSGRTKKHFTNDTFPAFLLAWGLPFTDIGGGKITSDTPGEGGLPAFHRPGTGGARQLGAIDTCDEPGMMHDVPGAWFYGMLG